MAADKLDTSVFTDDSGGRTRIVGVVLRVAAGLLGLGAAAVAISVFGHVTLPGLDEPLHVPGPNSYHPSNRDSTTEDPSRAGVQTPRPAAAQDLTPTGSGQPTAITPSGSGQPTAAAPKGKSTTAPTTPPTKPPTAKATGKPTAKPTVAANPTPRPAVPPGKPTSVQPAA